MIRLILNQLPGRIFPAGPPGLTGADQTPSGDIDLTDFASANKDMAIAFRYVTSGDSRRHRAKQVGLSFFRCEEHQLADGSVTALATIANAGWK